MPQCDYRVFIFPGRLDQEVSNRALPIPPKTVEVPKKPPTFKTLPPPEELIVMARATA
jgi:hypothetical protein